MCTSIRFTDDKGNMFLGRNLDWSCGYGEKVLITPAAYERPWAFAPAAASEHSLIGMGIISSDTPLYFDCGNEAGLAVAGLNFPGYAEYAPEAVEGKTNVAAYEFPLWVASNFTTVDDVEKALADVVIVAKPVNEMYPVSLLHWIIGDKTRSIVVEYMADGMHIYHDDVDALTNQPTFAWHRENLRNYISLTPAFPTPATWDTAELAPYGSGSGMRGIPGDYYSPSRFVRVSYLNAHYPVQSTEEANVTRMFKTLGGASMIKGAALMGNGDSEYTVYTGGFSAATRTYYHRAYDEMAITSVKLDDYDPKATTLTLV